MVGTVKKRLKQSSFSPGTVVNLQVDEVMLPNGKTSKREIVKHPGAVPIAVTPEKKIVLVEQYRKAMERVLVECRPES